MTKHFCDRCGKEADALIECMIPIGVNNYGSIEVKEVGLCESCDALAVDLRKKGTGVLLLLFEDFLPAIACQGEET